jgi:hypothetical protein
VNAFALVLALAAQDAPVAAEPVAPVESAPLVHDVPPPNVTPVAPVLPTPTAVDDTDARYARTHAVLEAFADEARGSRIAGAVGSGVLGAGLIGAGIAYVAVSHLDHQLSQKDHEDTQLAGFVIGGAALVPAAFMVAHIVMESPEEARLAAFEENASTRDEKRARVDAARASIAQEAAATSIAPTIGGIAFIAGGLVSAAAGGVFLALPHIPDVQRGPMTHATGAELIGAGVSSVGIGSALLVAGGSSSAPLQLTLLE